jgi:hypothetical protein
MEPHRLPRPGRQVEIHPEHLLVVRTYNDVVATVVDVKGRNPSGTRLDHLHQFKLLQVVAPDAPLRCYKEQWPAITSTKKCMVSTGAQQRKISTNSKGICLPRGVEMSNLGKPRKLAERILRFVRVQSMDGHRSLLSTRRDSAEVVASSVPGNGTHRGSHRDPDQHALVLQPRSRSGPFCELLVGGIGLSLAVGLVAEPGIQNGPASLLNLGCGERQRDQQEDFLPGGGCENESVPPGSPSHGIYGIFAAQLGLPQLTSRQEIPDADGAVITTGCQEASGRVNLQTSYSAIVSSEDGLAN